MSKRGLVFAMLLVVASTAGQSLSQGEPNNLTNGSLIANAASQGAGLLASDGNNSEFNNSTDIALAKNNTSEKANISTAVKTAPEIADLRYIWSIMGTEEPQITMALDQDGEDLFGAAKYEPEVGEAWNGVVIGTVSGDSVSIVISALKNEELVSTWLQGTFADEAINGEFFEVSSGTIGRRGIFNATSINRELSDYKPAKVAEPKPAETTPKESEEIAPKANNQSAQKPAGQERKFEDVRKWKDKVLTGVGDLSGAMTGSSFPGYGGG